MNLLRPPGKRRRSEGGNSSPPVSPSSSTSTLKISSTSLSHTPQSSAASFLTSTARSKGQQARRISIETTVSASSRSSQNWPTDDAQQSSAPSLLSPSRVKCPAQIHRQRRSAASTSQHQQCRHDRYRPAKNTSRASSTTQQPLFGGLYFSDLIVVAFFYAINLIRTCGLAELIDVAFKGFTYTLTRLPLDFYQRWSLSRDPAQNFTYSSTSSYPLTQSSIVGFVANSRLPLSKRASNSKRTDSSTVTHNTSSSTSVSASSATISSNEETLSSDDTQGQLSPFHHLIILLVRFACTNFPHLIPRILFAEETVGPLVRWRTGGGSAGIVREFSSDCSGAVRTTVSDGPSIPDKDDCKQSAPGFRAFWIGADAHVPVEVRRSDEHAKTASTLLYLHGGGFSLGSVAFYAEALIRIVTKVCRNEDKNNDARCVAVEYDLGPTTRFPGPLLQCLRCYAHLIEVEGIQPSAITLAGDSAGGNLAMAMLLCLDGQAKEQAGLAERDWSQLPFPGKAVLISPWADLRPSASLAFAHLRNPAMHQHKKPSVRVGAGWMGSSPCKPEVQHSRVSAWTEAMAHYEWDYVAAEALMHFAQLYAGVLETPRRVRGPMGWVANICAIVAGSPDVPDPVGQEAHKTFPFRMLQSLISPPRRLARAAHSILTEPLLDRKSTSAASLNPANPARDAFNEMQIMDRTALGALDPIFSKAERRTNLVPTAANLYTPTWDRHQFTNDRSQDPHFQGSVEQLENSKLINPAIGDWSRIRLEHGLLVIWGERERLADDIEIWVNNVRSSQRGDSTKTRPSRNDDRPCQDQDPKAMPAFTPSPKRQTIQERRSASNSPARPGLSLPGGEWICTAVEHGPAGVHAWPFVSMYLAGSELEREKGLEIIASFIANPLFSPSSTNPATPQAAYNATLAFKLQDPHDDYLFQQNNSPPHLNAVSPAGSIPSDISLRDDQEERDYSFNASSQDGSKDWSLQTQNELGLEGIYPHETVWTEPTPTPSIGMGTPISDEGSTSSYTDLDHQIGLGLVDNAQTGAQTEARQSQLLDMEPVRLHHIGHRPQRFQTNVGLQQGRATDGYSSVAEIWRNPQPHNSSASYMYYGGGGRSLAELEALDIETPLSEPARSNWQDEDGEEEDDAQDLPSPHYDNYDDNFYRQSPYSSTRYEDDEVSMDAGLYGLAHYTTARPEGLSDIAEEDSQMDTSSILSGGRSPSFAADASSLIRSMSPNASAHFANPGRFDAAYTPSVSEMARLREALQGRELQYQQRYVAARGSALRTRGERHGASPARFPIDDDDDDEDIANVGDRGREIGDSERLLGGDGELDAQVGPYSPTVSDRERRFDQGKEPHQRQTPSTWRSLSEWRHFGATLTGQQDEHPRLLDEDSPSPLPSTYQVSPSPARSHSSQNIGDTEDVWW